MRPSRGSRESIFMTPAAQQMAYDALAAGKVKVLVSDGQNNANMTVSYTHLDVYTRQLLAALTQHKNSSDS